MKKAEKRVCVCVPNNEDTTVLMNVVELDHPEIDCLFEKYCPVCNSFWREP